MTKDKTSVDLTADQIELITSALQTQEKILSVQSRAGQDDTAKTRLANLKRVIYTLRQQSKPPVVAGTSCATQSWSNAARSLFL